MLKAFIVYYFIGLALLSVGLCVVTPERAAEIRSHKLSALNLTLWALVLMLVWPLLVLKACKQ